MVCLRCVSLVPLACSSPLGSSSVPSSHEVRRCLSSPSSRESSLVLVGEWVVFLPPHWSSRCRCDLEWCLVLVIEPDSWSCHWLVEEVVVLEPLIDSLDELVVTVRPLLWCGCLESLGECLDLAQAFTLWNVCSDWSSL